MKQLFERPKLLTKALMHYCPGCTHGIVHRLIAETIQELDIESDTIGVASVGCSVFIFNYIDIDFQQASHGRAPAVATGIKRVLPDKFVFAYQGDGDLASIGTAEVVHAATRGENITIIFINNANYGMTGGQMAPTTVVGQKTTTTPRGRDPKIYGYPIKMCEMLSVLDGPAYIARASVHNPVEVAKAKKRIKRAFETQLEGKGFSMVEVLSICPTNWGLDPVASLAWLEQNLIPSFPLGEFVGGRRISS